jgi:hypothetical protein
MMSLRKLRRRGVDERREVKLTEPDKMPSNWVGGDNQSLFLRDTHFQYQTDATFFKLWFGTEEEALAIADQCIKIAMNIRERRTRLKMERTQADKPAVKVG